MTDATLVQKIEAYLFYEGGSATYKELTQVTGASLEDVRVEVQNLTALYQGRGIVCISNDSEVSLRVAPECAQFIEKMHKDSLAKEIGPASLEVIGILFYRGKSTQAEIDTIRGVNSSFSLRNLRMRGLITKTQDGPSAYYEASPEALAHLGIQNSNDVPNRESIQESLKAFEQRMSVTNTHEVPEVDTDSNE